MKSILIQAWTIQKFKNNYFLSYTHWVYLNEIVKYFDKITLLSPVKIETVDGISNLMALEDFKNVSIKELPFANSYTSSIKNFFSYANSYKTAKGYTHSYARYPTPFGWLQKIYLKKTTRIIHFVGDPIDAAKTNPNFSTTKKRILTTLFKPEHKIYLWACKGASVYTNGHHISQRLEKQGIKATPLISSTLNREDFHFNENKTIERNSPKIIYIGYLRKAKGVETVIQSFALLKEKYKNAALTIVGSGEFEKQLKEIVVNKNIQDVSFLGHIDNREYLNQLLREHNIFSFASLSEGSPRVILEAMANGINILSTPVGSLPNVFKDKEDIVFANFNDENDFYNKATHIIDNPSNAYRLRLNAFNKVKNFTIESFIKKIFHEA